MASKNQNGNNRVIRVLVIVVFLSMIISAAVIAIYYIQDHQRREYEQRDNKMNFVDISQDRIDLLLKHIGLINPIERRNLVLLEDLSPDLRLQIVIEELIETYKYDRDNEDHYIIQFEDVLEKALDLYNLKTYDYYPDEIDYYNYHFEKKGTKYVGTKLDVFYGEYHLFNSVVQPIHDELYLAAQIGYYEDKTGAYKDSTKTEEICGGLNCIQNVDLETLKYRNVHATYKIINNNFVLISITVEEESEE